MRRTGIGASEAAVVAGYHPFMTAWDLFNAKVYGDREPENSAMRAGSYLEPAVARMYVDECLGSSDKLYKCRTRRHPKHRWMLATCDRQIVREGSRGKIVEIKVPGRRSHGWGFDRDAVPAYVAFQAQQQMEVYGQDHCDVAAFFLLNRELAIYELERNDTLIESMTAINGRFWRENILGKVPPAIDGSDGADAYLRRTFGNPDEEIIAAPPEAEDWARRYAQAMADIRAADAVKKEAGNHLRSMIADHSGIDAPWGKATWKPKRSNPPWKRIAQVYREHLEALNADPRELDGVVRDCTPASIRVIRVKYDDALEAARDYALREEEAEVEAEEDAA
ncbi:MAG: YqaJ viral recombinase family protein [Deltaproteobacteria bacterium]|nr:YqaJ viral recombinase family protein [Deltaproteobacteria bacterium]